MKKYKNSLVLGKFMPVHLGHKYLIDVAIENSQIVNILICYNESQNINKESRLNSLSNIYKNNNNVKIYLLNDSGMPQSDSECKSKEDFYNIWIPKIKSILPELDCVFTSEEYGDDFAEYLGVHHFLVDKDRKKFPISATKIRDNIQQNWEFLPTETKEELIRRIAIMGPESVGKSELTKKLAEYFNTNFVQEWGRDIYESRGNKIFLDDFIPISEIRQKLEDDKLKESNFLIFCDTEDITTYLWSKKYFPEEYFKIEEWFLNTINKKKPYDLYILLIPNCPAVQDGTRLFLQERWKHYYEIRSELISKKLNFITIGGSWENRFQESIIYIKNLFF